MYEIVGSGHYVKWNTAHKTNLIPFIQQEDIAEVCACVSCSCDGASHDFMELFWSPCRSQVSPIPQIPSSLDCLRSLADHIPGSVLLIGALN